jgi:Raf kinase inhibitor-like YbhB/YbcL family protein
MLMSKIIGWLGLSLLGLILAGCISAKPGTTDRPVAKEEGKMSWSLTSPAFADQARIPDQYTGEGENISPPLNWGEPPPTTVSYALICNDPDAPSGNWIHWVLYDLGKAQRSLPEGRPKTETLPDLGGAKQGRNSSRQIGYSGPMPPPGKAHHYHFRLYALDTKLSLAPGASETELNSAMQGHILDDTELVGLYSR